MQRESASVKFAQMLRGDLTSEEEDALLDILAEKVSEMLRFGTVGWKKSVEISAL